MQCSKLGSLLDHLVSEAEQFGWHFNAERLGGFGIDGHVKFCRLHNRQVRGLLTFQNASRIDCGLAIRLRQISAITHESASQNVFAPRVNREHGVLRGQSPVSRSPWRKAATTLADSPGDRLLRKPTTGIAGCCARAMSGHAAAPPINEMNSRRLLITKDCTVLR